jgi:hypothetical protein
MNKEVFVYLMIGASSLLMISYLPHMFLTGYVEDSTVSKVQIGITIIWAIGLIFIGMDIVKKRRGLK